ncbi:MAG: hypothetical protein WDM92_13445 [Caulobacteraceae bacterium]
MLFGDRRSIVGGATLSADPAGRHKSVIAYWPNHLDGQEVMEATFCTVLTPLHKRVAAHNYEMVRLLNEDCEIHWNVVDNHDRPPEQQADQGLPAPARQHPAARSSRTCARRVHETRPRKSSSTTARSPNTSPGARCSPARRLQEAFDLPSSPCCTPGRRKRRNIGGCCRSSWRATTRRGGAEPGPGERAHTLRRGHRARTSTSCGPIGCARSSTT